MTNDKNYNAADDVVMDAVREIRSSVWCISGDTVDTPIWFAIAERVHNKVQEHTDPMQRYVYGEVNTKICQFVI